MSVKLRCSRYEEEYYECDLINNDILHFTSRTRADKIFTALANCWFKSSALKLKVCNEKELVSTIKNVIDIEGLEDDIEIVNYSSEKLLLSGIEYKREELDFSIDNDGIMYNNDRIVEKKNVELLINKRSFLSQGRKNDPIVIEDSGETGKQDIGSGSSTNVLKRKNDDLPNYEQVVREKKQKNYQQVDVDELALLYNTLYKYLQEKFVNQYYVKKILQDQTMRTMKRSYNSDIELVDDKPTHLVTKALKPYFERKGKKVHYFTEMSLKLEEELKIFYTDKKKYGFMFQDRLLEEYQNSLLEVSNLLREYDVVVIDRTHLDTEIFTYLVISDPMRLDYLNLRRSSIVYDHDFDHVIYVRCEEKLMIERQKKRNREGEKCSEEYLRDVYRAYETSIFHMYPGHVLFDSSKKLSEYDTEIDMKTGGVFFNIKLVDSTLIPNYISKLNPESYETICRKTFDSEQEFLMLRLYYNNHKSRKNALDKIDDIEKELNSKLLRINRIREGKELDENNQKNMLISMKRKGEIEIKKYVGGLVIPPKMMIPMIDGKMYPVADLDFNSMYPNVIITKNISRETKLDESQYDDSNIVTDGVYVISGFKPHDGDKEKFGVMPKISLGLLNDRIEAKKNIKEAKKANDFISLSRYESLSNALKVVENSLYEVNGYVFSPLYDEKVAASITGFPCWCLRKVIEFLESIGYSYGEEERSKVLQDGCQGDDMYIRRTDYRDDMEMFDLSARFNQKYQRTRVKDFWNMELHRPISKKGNKSSINFEADLDKHERMCLRELFDPLKHKIDILYYFESLKDVIASQVLTDGCAPISLLKRKHDEDPIYPSKKFSKPSSGLGLINKRKRADVDERQMKIDSFFKRIRTADNSNSNNIIVNSVVNSDNMVVNPVVNSDNIIVNPVKISDNFIINSNNVITNYVYSDVCEGGYGCSCIGSSRKSGR
ncbi:14382_t:CDS:10 [Dentiscutata heterogama]|uniref:14382_t:CDS:1 n=1 Tax=Dentiscutata heterogama TaxID=1316150 RepID=A0ACA9JUZ1_9GLOM|nr:14382_t:CDS:10 [Dentiscutata heterogama]